MARLPFNLRRLLARCPITTMLIVIAVVLHAAVLIYRRQFPENASEAFRVLGAARILVRVGEPDFHGLFELWDGQLWRVLVSGFHHGDLLHLAFNAVSLGFLGGLLEPRMRRPGFLAFVIAALLVSLVPEFLLEHAVVGLSGVACAMLGALLVVRRNDDDMRAQLPDGVVATAMLLLWLGIPLAWLELLPIANVAHFSGLAYGWIGGRVFFSGAARRSLQWSFVAAHLLLVPAAYLLMHPPGNGCYFWYQAAKESEFERRRALLKQAVALDRGLGGAWSELAELQHLDGSLPQAWATTLQGLRANRSNNDLLQLAQFLWMQFREGPEQAEALAALERTFPEAPEAWRARIAVTAAHVEPRFPVFSDHPDNRRPDGERYALDRLFEPPSTIDVETQGRPPMLPPIDPHAPGSAAEGVRL